MFSSGFGWFIMVWMGLGFQNMMNFSWSQLDWLHDYIILIIVFILIMVGGLLINIYNNVWFWKEFMENPTLELLWTMFPIVVLLNIGYFSMFMLYNHEADLNSSFSVKITGHQWYWTYDYTDFKDLEFDSYMSPLNELNPGDFRLLEVDNRTVVPMLTNIRLVITSSDVLHSWALPGAGLKVDANPGRLNMINFFSPVVGLFYGQCSEICGANHSFMPICVEVTNFFLFKEWVLSMMN